MLPRVRKPEDIFIDYQAKVLGISGIADRHAYLRRYRLELDQRVNLGREPEDLTIHPLHVDFAVHCSRVNLVT